MRGVVDPAIVRPLAPLLDIAGVPLAALIVFAMLKRGWLYLGREYEALKASRDRAWGEVERLRDECSEREKVYQERIERYREIIFAPGDAASGGSQT